MFQKRGGLRNLQKHHSPPVLQPMVSWAVSGSHSTMGHAPWSLGRAQHRESAQEEILASLATGTQ